MDIITLALLRKYAGKIEKGIEWEKIISPPTTLEGYGITDAATKEELEAVREALISVYHYKGSVETEADLEYIVDPEIGDVYNITDTDMNVAWTGTEWDELGSVLAPLTEEELDEALIIRIPPTYVAPTASSEIRINGVKVSNATFEKGTSLSPQITLIYNQNDGGDAYLVQSVFTPDDGSEPIVYTADELPAVFNLNNITSSGSISSIISYSQGPVKKDSTGQDYPKGRIPAGQFSLAGIDITAYTRGYYIGALDDRTSPITSELIKSKVILQSDADYTATTIGTVSSPVSIPSNKARIYVACPVGETGLTQVTMPSIFDMDVTELFVKQQTPIAVTTGSSTTNYNVWVFNPDELTDDSTFIFTLG